MIITADIRGDDRWTKRLHGVAARAQDIRPVNDDLIDVLLDSGRRQFREQPGWTPDKPATIRAKAKLGFPAATLVRTGRLRGVYTRRGAPGQRIVRRHDGLQFGLDRRGTAYYGVFQSKKRPLIKPQRIEQRQIRDHIRDYIFGGR